MFYYYSWDVSWKCSFWSRRMNPQWLKTQLYPSTIPASTMSYKGSVWSPPMWTWSPLQWPTLGTQETMSLKSQRPSYTPMSCCGITEFPQSCHKKLAPSEEPENPLNTHKPVLSMAREGSFASQLPVDAATENPWWSEERGKPHFICDHCTPCQPPKPYSKSVGTTDVSSADGQSWIAASICLIKTERSALWRNEKAMYSFRGLDGHCAPQ